MDQKESETKIEVNGTMQNALAVFIQKHNSLNPNENYSITFKGCQSKLFTNIGEVLIKNLQPNLTSFSIFNSQISSKDLEKLSQVKWTKMQAIEIVRTKLLQEQYYENMRLRLDSLKYIKLSFFDSNVMCLIGRIEEHRLQKIKISKCKMGCKQLMFLFSMKFNDLKVMILQYIEIGENECFCFQNSQIFNFPNLLHFQLKGCLIPQNFLSKIDKSKTPLLKKLKFTGIQFTGKQLFNKNSSKGWQQLQQLSLCENGIKNEEIILGLKNICEYPLLKLSKLYISMMKIILGDHLPKLAVRQFTKSVWDMLTVVGFSTCRLNQQCINILSKCRYPKLLKLGLQWNVLYDGGIGKLNNLCVPQIQEIYLGIFCDDLDHNNKTGFGILNLSKFWGSTAREIEVDENYMRENQIDQYVTNVSLSFMYVI